MTTKRISSRVALATVWLALSVYVVVLPISGTVALRNAAFAILVAMFALILVRQRIRPDFPLALPWLACAGVALVSIFHAVDPAYSRRNFVTEFAYGSLVFCFATTMSRRISLLNGLIALLAALNITSLIWLIGNYPFGAIYSTTDLYRASLDPFARVALNTNFLVSAMPLLALGAWRLQIVGQRFAATALTVLLVLDVLAMFLSGSRQSLVALAAAALCVVPLLPRHSVPRRGWFGLITAALLVASLLLFQLWRRQEDSSGWLPDIQLDPRWTLWQFSIEKILAHPWLGGGFGRGVFEKLYPGFVSTHPYLWHAHNMFLNRGIQMGIPGMAAFAWLWIALLRRLAHHSRDAGAGTAVAIAGISLAVGVLVKNLTDDFFIRDPALLFWLLMGAILGEIHRQDEVRA